MIAARASLLALAALAAAGCSPKPRSPAPGKTGFALSSEEFGDGAAIPVRFTCDGEGKSPPLRWLDPPVGTTEFALIMSDPGSAPITTGRQHTCTAIWPSSFPAIRTRTSLTLSAPRLRSTMRGASASIIAVLAASRPNYFEPPPLFGKPRKRWTR